MKRFLLIFSFLTFLLVAAQTPAVIGETTLQHDAITITAKDGQLGEPGFFVYMPVVSNGTSATGGEIPLTSNPLDTFISTVANGTENQVVGAYVSDVLAMPVVQQPEGNSGWISSSANTITQFAAADNFNTTGLLAHNTLAGIEFFNLEVGDEVVIVYGDGSTRVYQIDDIRQFQALEPTNPYSDFIDLETGEKLSATTLFYQVYTGEHHVTFQTCIEQNGNLSWGRIFILAHPKE